jgi:hypothetical protein
MTAVFLLSLSILSSLADSLFNSGFYELARIEYKREFYFRPEFMDRRDKRLNYALSLCYSDQDISYFELQHFHNDFEPLNIQEKKALANSYMYIGDHYTAKELLKSSDEYRLLAYTYILDHEWQKARELLCQKKEFLLTDVIDRYLGQKPRRAGTAMFFSAFCPGAGEIYAGDINTGVKAFLVNAGSGLLLYNAIARKKYIDAALIFNFLFQRFYFGSIFNAKRLVLEYNDRLENEYINEFAEQAHLKH